VDSFDLRCESVTYDVIIPSNHCFPDDALLNFLPSYLISPLCLLYFCLPKTEHEELLSKLVNRCGGSNYADVLDGCCFALCCFCFFLADALLDSSLFKHYKLTLSAAMCFKQNNLIQFIKTEIIVDLMHCGVYEVQSLFLCSTVFVVAWHFDHYLLHHRRPCSYNLLR